MFGYGPPDARTALGPRGWAAARGLIDQVRRQVDARLHLAALFGSRSRGDHRPTSDVDLLLVFDALPPSREPHASRAERLAAISANDTGIPLTVWCVSTVDLARGRRTPMLVDALHDALPVWPFPARVPRVAFTDQDAAFCMRCLLDRVAEGRLSIERALRRGDPPAAYRRASLDLVRLCTAGNLAHRVTRPRRGDAVRRCRRLNRWPDPDGVLGWAARMVEGRAGERRPPLALVLGEIECLTREIGALRERLGEGAGLATPWRGRQALDAQPVTRPGR